MDTPLDTIRCAMEKGEKCALVTITFVSGSVPSTVGQMLAITERGKYSGTIGGGNVEKTVIDMVETDFSKSFEFDFDLSKNGNMHMVCGGIVRGFVNVFLPNKKIFLFGAGHVSQKIAEIVKILPFDVFVIDDREEFSHYFPYAKKYLACSISEAIPELDFCENTFVAIVTRGHEYDFTATRAVLAKKTAYIGVLGSKAKISELKKNLSENGFSEDNIGKIHAPIGLSISNGTPEEIAFSIVAQMLQVKNM